MWEREEKWQTNAILLGKPKERPAWANASRGKEGTQHGAPRGAKGEETKLVTDQARKKENGQAWCAPRRQKRKRQ